MAIEYLQDLFQRGGWDLVLLALFTEWYQIVHNQGSEDLQASRDFFNLLKAQYDAHLIFEYTRKFFNSIFKAVVSPKDVEDAFLQIRTYLTHLLKS